MIARSPRKRYAQRLRNVVNALPYETQKAMLDGLRRYDRIIAGAYSDRKGGVCPMLAAHRCGGRTDFRSFARAWDSFTGAKRRARPATERELRTLEAQLEIAVIEEEQRRDLVRVAREASEDAARRHVDRRRRAKRSKRRTRNWLGPFRRWDRYRETVSRVAGELEHAGLLDQSQDRAIGAGESHDRREPAGV